MIIDTHAHGFPKAALAGLQQSGKSTAALPSTPWSDSERIDEIDRVGVAFEILSCPHLYMVAPDRLADVCRETNDRFLESARAHPDRFASFLHLPLHDVDAALAELERVAGTPGACGVLVPSNVDGRYLDEPAFAVLWAEFERRSLPVFMHPTDSPCYHDGEAPQILSWPFDTTLAAVRLITRGLFDRHPGLALILSHLGGTLPFLAHRIDMGFGNPSGRCSCARPPSSYVAQLYADLALGYSRPAFACAREQFGLEHLLFGSDHFNPRLPHLGKIVAFFESLPLPPHERELVAHGNAERLFRLNAVRR